MDIGKEKEVITVEPLEEPVPARREPAPSEPAREPVTTPEKEKELVPA